MTFSSMKFLSRSVAGATAGTFVLIGLLAAPAAGQYATDVARWVAQDAADPLPGNGIVFAGSSSIRRWEELTRDFADYNVIQRGLGGATFATYQPHVRDTVIAHAPRAVVVWLGTNDIAGGLSGNGVVTAFQTFASTVHASLPDTEIFFLGIMPTPGRQGNRAQENIANAGIAASAAANPRIHYVDLPAAFATPNPYNDPAFTSMFVDSIHLNRAGYDFWESVIRPQLSAVVAPDKVYVPNPATLKIGESLYFDFGPNDQINGLHTANPDVNGRYWNNWMSTAGGVNINAGEHVGNLVNALGTPTGIRMTITAGFRSNGFQNGGLRNPSPALLNDFAIDSVTGDYFFSTADGLQGGGNDDMGGGFMLDGLNPNLLYEFQFFGSRNTTETRITEYRVTGANDHTVLLQTSGNNIGANGAYNANDHELAIIVGVQPDQFGQVFIDLTLKQGSFAYINAMKVTAIGAIPVPVPVPVPEPSSLLLLLTCVTGLGFSNRRRTSVAARRNLRNA